MLFLDLCKPNLIDGDITIECSPKSDLKFVSFVVLDANEKTE